MVAFVVERYAVREAKKWRYTVRKAKIGRFAVRKGGGGVTLNLRMVDLITYSLGAPFVYVFLL